MNGRYRMMRGGYIEGHYLDCQASETAEPEDCTCRELERDAFDAEMEARVDRERERERE